MTTTLTTPTTFGQLAEGTTPLGCGEIAPFAIDLLASHVGMRGHVDSVSRRPAGFPLARGTDMVFRVDLHVRDALRRPVPGGLGVGNMEVRMRTNIAVHFTHGSRVQRQPAGGPDFDDTTLDVVINGEYGSRRLTLTGSARDYEPLGPELCRLKDRFILEAAFGEYALHAPTGKRRKRWPLGR